jgi:hypothetical protein
MRATLLFFLISSAIIEPVLAEPSACPNDPSVVGYSDWETLLNDIGTFRGGRDLYILCPETTFMLNDEDKTALEFSFSSSQLPPMKLQCGPNGKSSGNCIVHGGHHHVWVDRYVGGALTFQGIVFEKATRESIWAGDGKGLGRSHIHFDDCIWRDNVYDYPYDDQVGCLAGCAAVMGGIDAVVSFSNCQFLDNEGKSGTIYGQGMELAFDHCIFKGNTNVWRSVYNQPTGSAITMWDFGSSLSLSKNCFIDNHSFGTGTVKLSVISATNARIVGLGSRLQVNENNYFDDNSVALANMDNSFFYCHNGIYKYDKDNQDVCVPGTSTCCRVEYPEGCPSHDGEPRHSGEAEDGGNMDISEEIGGALRGDAVASPSCSLAVPVMIMIVLVLDLWLY